MCDTRVQRRSSHSSVGERKNDDDAAKPSINTSEMSHETESQKKRGKRRDTLLGCSPLGWWQLLQRHQAAKELVCVYMCASVCAYTGLWGCNRWGIYCRDSVRSHWWQYQWDVTHTHTHRKTTDCKDCSGDGWGIIRMRKLFNKVVLFWMCSVTSC